MWTVDGSPVASSQAQQRLAFDGDGQADANAVRQATERTLDVCLQRLRAERSGQIVGVGWASFAMSWLGVDGSGKPVTPVYTTPIRSAATTPVVCGDDLDGAGKLLDTYQRTGTPIHTAYAPAQLLRLAAEDAARLARGHLADAVGPPPRPVDGRASPRSAAARPGGRVSPTVQPTPGTRNWSTACSSSPTSCRLSMTTQGITGLSAEYAKRWPELVNVPFFLAVGDGAAANIGTSCTNAERLALTIGTSGATRVVVRTDGVDTINVPPGLWVYPVDSHRRLLGGSLTDGGSLYTWLRRTLAKENNDQLLAEATALAPDAHGLTVLPFLRSERSPGWATAADLTISGISAETTPAHILRAGLEAVAYRFRLIADRLAPSLADGAQIYASGGALQSAPLWRQILADVLQRPVHLTEIDEATSRGVAVLAAQALGLVPEDLPLLPIAETAYPSAAAGERYTAAVARQQVLYRKILGESAQYA
ncbi:MAG: FGGY-family carbohydrate kinase [Caldilineaceae bacterium]